MMHSIVRPRLNGVVSRDLYSGRTRMPCQTIRSAACCGLPGCREGVGKMTKWATRRASLTVGLQSHCESCYLCPAILH